MEEGRADGMARLARRLAEQEVMRPDVTVGDAADLLWVLTSLDSFDLLYTGRARPVEKVADALIAMAERSLCREGLRQDGKTPCRGRAGEVRGR